MLKGDLRERLRAIEKAQPRGDQGFAASIKFRAGHGCFHREHSPHAFAFLDEHFAQHSPAETELVFEEHESGPEVLVFLAVASAGLTVAKSLLDLVTAVVKARSAGTRKGDNGSPAVEIVVRRVRRQDEQIEERIVRVSGIDRDEREAIEQALLQALKELSATSKDGA